MKIFDFLLHHAHNQRRPSPSSIHVHTLPITEPENYALVQEIIGQELGGWQFQEFPRGQHLSTYTTDTQLYILAGRATLAIAEEQTTVRAGDLVTISSGSDVHWTIRKPVNLRYKSLEAQRIFDTFQAFAQHLFVDKPHYPARGSFHPCSDLSSIFDLVLADALLVVMNEPDALTDALFTLPRSILSLHSININTIRHYPLYAIQPSKEHRNLLHDAEALMLINKVCPFENHEDLFIRHDHLYFRWHPEDEGNPFIEELLGIINAKNIFAQSSTASKRYEQIVELILSTLWGKDTPQFMCDYMMHPVEIPYEVPYLYLPGVTSVSETLKQRWHIHTICSDRESVIVPDFAIRINGLTPQIVNTSTCSCIVEWLGNGWSSQGEYATWEYHIEWENDEVRLIHRKLLFQHD